MSACVWVVRRSHATPKTIGKDDDDNDVTDDIRLRRWRRTPSNVLLDAWCIQLVVCSVVGMERYVVCIRSKNGADINWLAVLSFCRVLLRHSSSVVDAPEFNRRSLLHINQIIFDYFCFYFCLNKFWRRKIYQRSFSSANQSVFQWAKIWIKEKNLDKIRISTVWHKWVLFRIFIFPGKLFWKDWTIPNLKIWFSGFSSIFIRFANGERTRKISIFHKICNKYSDMWDEKIMAGPISWIERKKSDCLTHICAIVPNRQFIHCGFVIHRNNDAL